MLPEPAHKRTDEGSVRTQAERGLYERKISQTQFLPNSTQPHQLDQCNEFGPRYILYISVYASFW